ncbi:MAG: DUF4275 family protein [Candidatus Izemoplasmatales bacterium]|jgi:hypothetical protein|nr:DUF4275 family protein [Candidatus Izemoplasmatales bacterium]
MKIESFFREWYQAFAYSVSKDIMDERVLAEGNLPWHIFTWGEVDAVEGLEALNLLNNIDLNAVITFSGFPDDFSKIKMIKSKRKLNELLHNSDDVYITALDFSWTFVKTHEDYIGPYFKFRDR